MYCNWQQTSPDKIEIQATPRPILMLFGLPFLGIGLWMFWNVLGALKDVLLHRVTFMDDIFAFTLLPIFGALFIWPGVLLVLTRKRWVINATMGRAEETTSVLTKSWSRNHPLDSFKAVRAYQGKADSRTLAEEVEDQKEATNYQVKQPYCVDLVSREAKKSSRTIAVTSGAVDALALGSAVAALTRLPLVNDTAKDGEDYEEEGTRYKPESA